MWKSSRNFLSSDFVLVLAAIFGGQWVSETPFMGSHLHSDGSDAGNSHLGPMIRRIFVSRVAAACTP